MPKKIKRFITSLILIILALALAYILYVRNYNMKYKDINLKDFKAIEYIKVADEASKGKLQVNWKQVAAIEGVIYKNDFTLSSDMTKLELSNKFLEQNQGQFKVKESAYRLLSMDEVMTELGFKSKERERANKYLEDLAYKGTLKEELSKDSIQTEFINSIKDEAMNGYVKYGIFPSVTIAQAILESGWGESELTVKANNLFGIKADSSWKGEKISMKTSEYNNEMITDNFRVYDNKNDSINDHREFLYKNPRYKGSGVFNCTHYIEQVQAIEKGGYSTAENHKGEKIYSELLTTVIRDYNLQLVDYEVEMNYLTGKIK
ncbi:glycoside hydrolase family 73 protein [Clostridium algidicarnis]|uniref:Flagellum-specific peptidoglycan hydrolase FlgJ n=2 Tax=Clostridium algidicarnis TaxID=37659 RepID=A0A2S6FZX5_9CLOT|nr:glucosaminidase domain-containing protein [Clostridium algidicarnis]MBB6630889.1 glucosaminidase domain-containing protein [Clostridium algidicarnis]MBB6696792.1 glucosaminidase domain-containing protein [Clostridium algidicarnis]MBU3192739.1 glucosaminidase domain-containing protein [Clostridium algidicarnis]MBU3206804.1 glucosaminidase domain-containing protein [Clostridium algidicarnis]MBU3219375.1 glucosaminidase domain-containing protein [Clostridium algidicarnis]